MMRMGGERSVLFFFWITFTDRAEEFMSCESRSNHILLVLYIVFVSVVNNMQFQIGV